MTSPSLARELALRVLALESGARARPEDAVAAAERVIELLHQHLARWFGGDGFHAILARAVDRARVEQPALAAIRVVQQGELHVEGLTEAARAHDAETMHEALVTLIASLLSLLGRLVGDDLVSRLTHQIWPAATPLDLRTTDTRTTRRE